MTTVYDLAIVDPPWPKKKGGIRKVTPNQTRELDYPTLSVDGCFELLDVDVFPHMAVNHSIFLWVVDEFLTTAERYMEFRGYRRHARFTWDKGNGVAPAFSVRYTTEYMIWFYAGKFQPVDKSQRGKFGTCIREGNREHSRKPDADYSMLELLYPSAARIDVFSRKPRPGWAQYGNDVNKFS